MPLQQQPASLTSDRREAMTTTSSVSRPITRSKRRTSRCSCGHKKPRQKSEEGVPRPRMAEGGVINTDESEGNSCSTKSGTTSFYLSRRLCSMWGWAQYQPTTAEETMQLDCGSGHSRVSNVKTNAQYKQGLQLKACWHTWTWNVD